MSDEEKKTNPWDRVTGPIGIIFWLIVITLICRGHEIVNALITFLKR